MSLFPPTSAIELYYPFPNFRKDLNIPSCEYRNANTPTIEDQINALPRNLFDSDSDCSSDDGCDVVSISLSCNSIPSYTSSSWGTSARSLAVQSLQKANSSSSMENTSPFQTPNPSYKDSPEISAKELSVSAVPFVPSSTPLLAFFPPEDRKYSDLLHTIRIAASIDALESLISAQIHLDAACTLATIHRMVALHCRGVTVTKGSGNISAKIAQFTLRSAHLMSPEDTATVVRGLVYLQAPIYSSPFKELVEFMTETLVIGNFEYNSVEFADTFCTLSMALQSCIVPLKPHVESRLHHIFAHLRLVATKFLERVPQYSIAPSIIPHLAFALNSCHPVAPKLLAQLADSAREHIEEFDSDELVHILRFLLANQHTDPLCLGPLALAFQLSHQSWCLSNALEFLSLCRAHKPLLAAQRPHATLLRILDFIQPFVSQCTTSHLSSVLLDLAFIGCQSFKSHLILTHIGSELQSRIQRGEITCSHAVELADAVRSLDKLEHCNDALSRAAGPLLSQGRLPAKQIANVVVSLARQRNLSPCMVAAAHDLLTNHLEACNGQDVSQILFGLVLDRHAGTADTFAAVSDTLAKQLCTSDTFGAQSVSRILSSYAKVGCFHRGVFQEGKKRLLSHLGELKPPFIAELANSLASAGQTDSGFMRRLGLVVKLRFPEYSPSMLCTIIHAFSCHGRAAPDLFKAACTKLSNVISRGQLPIQETVQLLSSIANLNYRHSGVLNAVHDWLLTHRSRAPIPTLIPILAYLHTLENATDRLVDSVTIVILSNLSAFTPAECPKLDQLIRVLTSRPSAPSFGRSVNQLQACIAALKQASNPRDSDHNAAATLVSATPDSLCQNKC